MKRENGPVNASLAGGRSARTALSQQEPLLKNIAPPPPDLDLTAII